MTLISILLQALLILVVLRMTTRQEISPILTVALLFHAVMWYVIPVAMVGVLGRSTYFERLIESDTFARYAIIESVAFLLTLLFMFRSKPYFGVVLNNRLSKQMFDPSASLFFLCSFFGLTVLLLSSNPIGVSSYWDRNAFQVTASGTSAFNLIGSFAFLRNLVLSFAYVNLLFRWPKQKHRRVSIFISLILIAGVNIESLRNGGRISLDLPIVLTAMYGMVHRWPKRKFVYSVLAAMMITLLIGGSLTLGLAGLRGGNEMSLGEIYRYSYALSSSKSSGEFASELSSQFISKFDGISWGAFLVERGGYGAAGWRPYEGVLFGLIPRIVMPNKPVPESIDGTYRGHPSRLVPALAGIASSSRNVGVSPAAISIWQHGYAGIAALIIVNVLNLYLINSLLLASSPISKTLGFGMLGLPALASLFGAPDAIFMNIERIAAGILLLSLLAGFLFEFRRRVGCSQAKYIYVCGKVGRLLDDRQ